MAAMSDNDATMATATRQPPPSSLRVLRQHAQQVFFRFFRFSSLCPHQHVMASHGHPPAPGINVNTPPPPPREYGPTHMETGQGSLCAFPGHRRGLPQCRY